MKAATGELNLTVITIVAIAAIIGFFWLMWDNAIKPSIEKEWGKVSDKDKAKTNTNIGTTPFGG